MPQPLSPRRPGQVRVPHVAAPLGRRGSEARNGAALIVLTFVDNVLFFRARSLLNLENLPWSSWFPCLLFSGRVILNAVN